MCEMFLIQSADDAWLMYWFKNPLKKFCYCGGGCDQVQEQQI